ncbi:hypothetical protein CHUAL_001293 [Chamberlinius hualienensis]
MVGMLACAKYAVIVFGVLGAIIAVANIGIDEIEEIRFRIYEDETVLSKFKTGVKIVISLGVISLIEVIVAIYGANKKNIILLGIHAGLLLINIVGCICISQLNLLTIFGIILSFIRFILAIILMRLLRLASIDTVKPMKPDQPDA